MKLILTISAMILFLITGCESGKQPANDFLTVDITANYPKKELILQDFLDVEYIPLETNEEFITSASMQAIGKNLIILRNKNGQDGDIFIFDRTGKSQRKINRSGQGSQEYTNIGSIALDEEKGHFGSCPNKTGALSRKSNSLMSIRYHRFYRKEVGPRDLVIPN